MAVETRERIERIAYRNSPPIRELAPTREKSLAQEIVSVVPKADPIEIFPGQQETQKPAFKKTPRMLGVEQIIQEDLPGFLTRKYSEEGLSTPDISQMITEISGGNIKVREATINNWLRKFNSQVRPRLEAVKLAWQNPEKRERRIEGIHSRMRKREKSKSLSKFRLDYWQNLSESEKENRLRLIRENYRTAMLRRMSETLGENPAERLNEMYWQEDLSSKEIGEKLGKSPSIVLEWMRFLGITARKRGRRAGETTYGYIRNGKEEKSNLVEEASRQGLVEKLDERERYVIWLRYPAEGRKASSTKIAKELGVSRQRVGQIEKGSLGKLQVLVNSQPSGLPQDYQLTKS